MSDLQTTFLANVQYIFPPEGENKHFHIIVYGEILDGKNTGLMFDDRVLSKEDKSKILKLREVGTGLATFEGVYNDLDTWKIVNMTPHRL